jgi:hypothetical protein
VTAPETGVIPYPEALTAELVARHCGTKAPGALELLEVLGIDLATGSPPERSDPVPAVRPESCRRGTRRKK